MGVSMLETNKDIQMGVIIQSVKHQQKIDMDQQAGFTMAPTTDKYVQKKSNNNLGDTMPQKYNVNQHSMKYNIIQQGLNRDQPRLSQHQMLVQINMDSLQQFQIYQNS